MDLPCAQALKAQTADDRNIVCTEIFNDLTADVEDSTRSTAFILGSAV